MRLRAVLSALLASVGFHLGVAGFLLPQSMKPESRGGDQRAVFSIGTDTLDALMSGVETLEAEPLETVQAGSGEETMPEVTESEAVESDKASRTGTAVASEPDTAELRPSEPLARARPERVQSEAGGLLSAAVPGDESTTTPNMPVAVPPRPATEKKRSKPIADKTPASPGKTTRQPERAQAKTTRPPTAGKTAGAGAGGNSSSSAKHGSSGSKTAQPSRKEGNAAASNYPGEVYAKIARTRRKRAGGNGTARIRFSIGSGGGLATIVLAASSGNARVDDAALAHVRRSAPFPRPPAGAQRSFVIPIQFKR
ncbi:MAG: energy transducer TonB [Nitratireductor sp.]|nr:energy transducer TonB [Nitratireductor sp.]